MQIHMIAAMNQQRVIGRDGQMPWHLPADLAHFKQVTMGKPIVMGRLTQESIGRPLPGRRNIVLSRQVGYAVPGCEVFQSWDVASAALASEPVVMVVGGGHLYQMLLPQASRLFLTYIENNEPGDTYFPELDSSDWLEVSRQRYIASDSSGVSYAFVELMRLTE